MAIVLSCGPRSAELRRLTWGDLGLDDERPTLSLFGKGRQHRTIRLPQVALQAVRGYRAALVAAGVTPGPSDALSVSLANQDMARLLDLASRPLQPISRAGMYHLVKGRMLQAGIEGAKVGPHRLRSTAATLAYLADADPISIQRMLGHARLDTTVRHYIRPAQNLQEAPGDRVVLETDPDLIGHPMRRPTAASVLLERRRDGDPFVDAAIAAMERHPVAAIRTARVAVRWLAHAEVAGLETSVPTRAAIESMLGGVPTGTRTQCVQSLRYITAIMCEQGCLAEDPMTGVHWRAPHARHEHRASPIELAELIATCVRDLDAAARADPGGAGPRPHRAPHVARSGARGDAAPDVDVHRSPRPARSRSVPRLPRRCPSGCAPHSTFSRRCWGMRP